MLIAGIIKPKEAAGTAHWQYTTELERHDPLHEDGSHFRRMESMALFEPEYDGGLGLRVAPQLLEARIRAAGQMARPGIEGPRWMTFKEAQVCYRHLPSRAESEWLRTVEALNELDLDGVFPERDNHSRWGQRSLCSLQGELGLSKAKGSPTRG